MSDVVLSARNISKSYPGVQALDKVSLDLARGEIHALLGENGAGKSTFVKILTGASTRDEGEILVNGRPTSFRTTADAFEAGISIVFQELSQVPGMTVAENIYLGEWPRRGGLVDWRRMNRETAGLLERFRVHADPTDPVTALGVGTRQMIEILKACRKPHTRILILDEPTSALSEVETETLFAFLRGLKRQSVAVIYISHRLGEIQRICDRITIFRNGRKVETAAAKDLAVEQIVRLMVGRSLDERFPKKIQVTGSGGLSVKGMTTPKLRSVSIDVRRGEILGLSGLTGAGKTELLRAIFGADPRTAGQLTLDGRPILVGSPRQAIRCKVGLLPESRKDQALVLTANNVVNASLASLNSFAAPFLSLGRERLEASRQMADVDVRPPDPDNMVVNLSGGNQQKVILARWLMAKSSVLLFDEPTRGIDVGAKYQIYSIISELARSGCCVLVASSEVEELVGICHRVLVLSRGAVVAQVEGGDLTEERLLQAAVEPGDQ